MPARTMSNVNNMAEHQCTFRQPSQTPKQPPHHSTEVRPVPSPGTYVEGIRVPNKGFFEPWTGGAIRFIQRASCCARPSGKGLSLAATLIRRMDKHALSRPQASGRARKAVLSPHLLPPGVQGYYSSLEIPKSSDPASSRLVWHTILELADLLQASHPSESGSSRFIRREQRGR
jgi:hypothetical protein